MEKLLATVPPPPAAIAAAAGSTSFEELYRASFARVYAYVASLLAIARPRRT